MIKATFLASLFLLLLTIAVPASQIYSHEDNKEIVVIMYQNGYEPKDLRIHTGDILTFKNQSQADRWPASNIHPTHAIYPEFDPGVPVKSGESWSFKFDKPGSYFYHDHINSKISGKISVITNTNTENNLQENNQTDITFRQKLKIILTNLYYKINPAAKNNRLSQLSIFELSGNEDLLEKEFQFFSGEELMDRLLNESGDGYDIDCHTQAHILGRLAYKLEGSQVFSLSGPECHSGFYHGAMESLLIEEGLDNLTDKITNICSDFKTDFGVFECFHGVGHGVMAYTGYDLIESLSICANLNSQFYASSCNGGVFMENIVAGQGNGAIEGHSTKWLNEDPNYPCNILEGVQQSDCYLMQTSWMLSLFNYDFQKVSDACYSSDIDDSTKAICFQSYGRDAAGYSLRQIEPTLKICALVSKEYYAFCINGAVQVIVDFFGQGLESQAFDFCQKVENQKAKEMCNNIVSTRIKNMFEIETANQKCDLAADYQEECRDIISF